VHSPHSSGAVAGAGAGVVVSGAGVVGAGVGAAAVVELGDGVGAGVGAGVGTGVVAGAGVVLGMVVGAADSDEDVDDTSTGSAVVGDDAEHTAVTTKLLSLHFVPVGTGLSIGTPWAH